MADPKGTPPGPSSTGEPGQDKGATGHWEGEADGGMHVHYTDYAQGVHTSWNETDGKVSEVHSTDHDSKEITNYDTDDRGNLISEEDSKAADKDSADAETPAEDGESEVEDAATSDSSDSTESGVSESDSADSASENGESSDGAEAGDSGSDSGGSEGGGESGEGSGGEGSSGGE